VQMVAGAGEQGDACGPDGCAVPAQP
jgi:hypothetical protein